MAKNVTLKITNNAGKVKGNMKEKKEKILYAIGLKWQSIATKIITQRVYTGNKPYPLTGRLRASLSFATSKRKGPGRSVGSSEAKDYITSSSKDAVTVGSNVIYAAKVNTKHKFLEDSVMSYRDSYKAIAEQIMKQ